MKIIAAFALSVFIGGGSVYAYYVFFPRKPEVAAKPVRIEHCVDRVTYIQFDNAVAGYCTSRTTGESGTDAGRLK